MTEPHPCGWVALTQQTAAGLCVVCNARLTGKATRICGAAHCALVRHRLLRRDWYARHCAGLLAEEKS